MNELKFTSFSDFVQNMVDGLMAPRVSVNMNTYGDYNEGICFGCAATNAACHRVGKTFTGTEIKRIEDRADFLDVYPRLLDAFESAVDSLRNGNIEDCLHTLRCEEFLFDFPVPYSEEATPDFELPGLTTYNYKDHLSVYQQYADWLKSKGL